MKETIKNLTKAFTGESQARNKYTYFSSTARKEGFEQISAIFQETADNEKEHAKIFFEHLSKINKAPVNTEIEFPPSKIGTTAENLLAAAEGERHEWGTLYPKFEKIARQEGFKEIADSFKEIAEVEEEHEKRYRKLLENVKTGKVFKKDKVTKWKCRNCGYVHEGKEAPKLCPACKHAQAFYEVLAENY